jgi:ABC-2 type transport system permease protein
MSKTLLIARWEFLATVTRRAYIFTVVAMPLMFGLISAIPVLSTRSAATRSAGVPVALVDPAGIVDLQLAARLASETSDAAQWQAGFRRGTMALRPDGLIRYDTLQPALADLNARQVSAVYELGADYLASGEIKAYGRGGGMFPQMFAGQRQGQVVDAIRASLLQAAVPDDKLARAYAPAANLKRFTLDSGGQTRPVDDRADALGPFAGSFVVLILLTMAIFFSAGFLQQGTVEDRQNRVMEVLLSSVTAEQLLVGKLLGLGAAGLLQVGFYLLLIIVPGMTFLSLFQIPILNLLVSLVYFVIGYTLFACLMAGFGMIGRTQQETAQLSAIWTLTAVSPLWFMMAISAAPNGWLARGLSYFPLTSPVTMILRLSLGEIPAIDIAVSVIIGAASIYLALHGAARIFRAATLMYGKRPNLPELMRWLRAT